MEIYRITQEPFADDLSGNGARLFGGRWNSEGLFALYASSSRALALLETLAHSPAKLLQQKNYILISIAVPDSIPVQQIEFSELPADWDAPDIRSFTRKRGDEFLEKKGSLILAVPSVLIPEENNYLLNPGHPDMKKIKRVHKRRIYFDKRLEGNA